VRLPLTVAGLITIALAVFLWAAYAQMERALGEAGRTRAQGAVDQLVNLMAPAAQQRALDMKRIAADPALRDVVVRPDDVTRRAAEARLETLASGGRQIIEVWDRAGTRVLALAVPETAHDVFPPPQAPAGDVRFGEAGGEIFADLVEPIASDSGSPDASPGYLVVRRPVSSSRPEALNNLIGHGARIHIGGATGPWTDLIAIISPTPFERSGSGVTEYRAADGEQRVSAAAGIAGTPLFVSVEFPRAIFLAPARTFLYRTALIAVMLVVVAGFVSRIAIARITTPLAALTDASEAIAAGDYKRRVETSRSDELGRLGSAFNSMVTQVQDAHEHLTLAVQGSRVGIWEWSADSDRVLLSAQWKRMLGYGDEELNGTRALMQKLVHPDDWAGVNAGIRACLSGEADSWESEHRLRQKDGTYIWVLARGVARGSVQGQSLRIAGTSIDITVQKLARDEAIVRSRQAAFVADVAVALTEGGELRDMLTRCAQAMVQHLDAGIARIWTTSATEPAVELQATAGSGPWLDAAPARVPIGDFAVGLVAAEQRPIIDNAVDAARYRSEGPVDAQLGSYAGFPLVLGDRLVGVMSMFGRLPLTESTLLALGSVARTVALGIERKRLDESRSRFEDLLESATDFVTIGRLVGPPLYINRAARQAFEIGPDEQVLSLFAFRPPEFQEQFEDTVLASALRDGMWRGQAEYISRSGRVIPVSQVSVAHKDATGSVQYLSTISRDISAELRTAQEREVLEEQLRRTQRIEAIGQLAGGLAHDFNNLLTIILGYANVLSEEFDEGDPRRADIEQIRHAGDRASQLTRQLLAFSRKQILNPVVLNPNDLIGDIRPMLSRLVGEAIDVVLNCDPKVSAIRFDPAQMELILVNLAVNARDAMPQGGTLKVDTADVELDEDFCRTHVSVEPGHYVRLSVTDTGVGIDEATKRRIFEPFFTTKGRDKGTGLGLATVFGIVRQSGGTVWVYSEPGLGASFKIFLPAVMDARPEPAVRTLRQAPTGSETILVVEDEAGVRGLVEAVLRRAGYTVVAASRPADAIQIAADPGQRIDLLITDVVMPDLNGAALSRQICQARPTLRVLFMSGFADEMIERQGVLTAGTVFLQKPFTGSDLACKVRQVLDQPADPGSVPPSEASARVRV
jgi:PAS domain S-box-containing protein